MTFGEFKKLNFADMLPIELVLAQALYDGNINIRTVLEAYTNSLERERQESNIRFAEACVCINQHLSGNYRKKEDKTKLVKRMIHILNKTQTLVPHIYDQKYGYTEDDEKEWEEFCKTIYREEL